MGFSTDGIFCYGFQFDEEEGGLPAFLLDDVDFDEFVAELYGLSRPSCSYESDEAQWSEYWKKNRELVKQVGIDLVSHCSGDYPMYILAISESVEEASRGNPIELGQSIVVGPEWQEKLREFCEKAKIEFQEPQFILCSNWS